MNYITSKRINGTNVSSKNKSVKTKPVLKLKKKFTRFKFQVYSRHPSHERLRTEQTQLLPFRSVVRLGSLTSAKDGVSNGGKRIECNSIQSIKNSASKLLMKRCFTRSNVKTANWFTYSDNGFYDSLPNTSAINVEDMEYPIVAKHIYGSRGSGNTLLNDAQELISFLRGKTYSNYIFEKFYNFSREYRLHVTSEGCFYTCRKVLKTDTHESNRWYRNDSNSNWIMESNDLFDKPCNWNEIVSECVKALNSTGLDIGGFDVKVQSARDKRDRLRENPEFIVIESNSACSHGDVTSEKYLQEIPKVLRRKFNENKI